RGVGQVLGELIRGETGDGADEGSSRRDVEFVEDGGRLLRQGGEDDEFAAVDDVLIAVTDLGGLEGLGEMLCAVGIAWGEEEPKAARVGVAGLTAGKAFDHRRGDLSDSDETDAGHLLLLERLSARLGVCSSDRIVSSTSEGERGIRSSCGGTCGYCGRQPPSSAIAEVMRRLALPSARA